MGNHTRRIFLQQVTAVGGLAALSSGVSGAIINSSLNFDVSDNTINILNKPEDKYFRPLETVKVKCNEAGYLSVIDGEGNIYYESTSLENELSFQIGGAIGNQLIFIKDKKGNLIDVNSIHVGCKTEINDKEGKYKQLLDNLYFSMVKNWSEAGTVRHEGKFHHVFVIWLRDHVHAMKGMKYFYPKLESGIDLYADTQREDGMIWDNYYSKKPGPSYWDQRFSYGGFYKATSDDIYEFKRIPVENDVEYLFIEGIYYTWKATGNDEWMKGLLDKAIKAYEYSTTDPYRWSEKYKLLKRGFTIDTWDFQADEDAAISAGEGNMPDAMVINRGKTRFGVMYGDNTGFAIGCRYLAEMLEYADRGSDAKKYRALEKEIRERLDEIAWNGNFYKHHVPEDPSIIRDFGVDHKKQVSLSNAYSLNRGLKPEQAKAIIATYKKIQGEMPKSSPGEWYTIYPPFEKGFGDHNSKWEYMNGGVTTIVAGELAHGAYENGEEKYATSILDRLLDLSNETKGYLHCTYRGAEPEVPQANFTPLSVKAIANTDFVGNTKNGVMGWTDEGENDLHEMPVGKQTFNGVPFNVVDPSTNGRKACLGLSGKKGYTNHAILQVNNKAQSLYILQTTGKNYYAGNFVLNFADGSKHVEHIASGKISNWWYPVEADAGLKMPKMKIAWSGKNKKCDKVGVTMYGLKNPSSEKFIKSIEFNGPGDENKWMILAVTLSDKDVYFKPDMISGGIPDNWGAAAVVYALVEGLVGVKDKGVAFDEVLFAPRWESAGVKEAEATIKYEASGGYLSYKYKLDNNTININYTSNSRNTRVELLLPDGANPSELMVNNTVKEFTTKKVQNSEYLVSEIEGVGVFDISVKI